MRPQQMFHATRQHFFVGAAIAQFTILGFLGTLGSGVAHLWDLWVSSEATDLHFACLEPTNFKLQKGFALQLEI